MFGMRTNRERVKRHDSRGSRLDLTNFMNYQWPMHAIILSSGYAFSTLHNNDFIPTEPVMGSNALLSVKTLQ